MTVDPSLLTPGELNALAEAGEEVAAIEATMRAFGTSPRALLVGDGEPEAYRHYPAGDIYDFVSHSQYYFHCHRAKEYGHAHLFLRPMGMPVGCAPQVAVGGADSPCHLIAVGFGHNGFASELFTTNRWVTGESWYEAEAVIRMLPCFHIDQASGGGRVGRWLTALLKLYRPLIVTLVRQRDLAVAEWREAHGNDALNDDRLDVTSHAAIDVNMWRQALAAAQRVQLRQQ
ncbi:MAG TPA: hypothetical protein VK196_15900 [Magnetospirillum sp.]|nr:hypothetical protein [Magnetospirillum sp.]